MAEFAVDLRRSLIRAVPGSGEPRPCTIAEGLLLAAKNLDYWRGAYDLATGELLDSPLGDDEALQAGYRNLEAVRLRLAAAVKRYRRALAESQGRRWLRLVGGPDRG